MNAESRALTAAELNRIAGGAPSQPSNTTIMQAISNIAQLLNDMQKTVINNIR